MEDLMQNKVAPKLRFDEFDSEWVRKKLGEVVEKIGDGLHGTPIYSDDSDIYFINGNNLTNGKIEINENTKKVEKSIFEKNDKGLNKNTLLISINGTIGNIAKYNNEKVMLGKSVGYFNFKENTDFYYHIFHTNMVQNFFISELTGSTIKNLSLKTLRETIISLPSLPEQKKIATFLTAVDAKINQLKTKKDLLLDFKKGVMQKIFSQQLRFKDENGNNYPNWEEKVLGKIGVTLNGLTGKTKDDFGVGKPYVQYKQIFDNSKIDISKCGLVNVSENETQTKVEFGDVFFTTSSETPNEIGTASVLLDEVVEMYLNSFCFGYRIDKNVLYPPFSQFLFRSNGFRKKMIPLAQGSTRYNISKSSFLKLKVLLPKPKEQEKIADFLSLIDAKIEQVAKQIKNTQTFKKGLLQQMFV